MSPMNKMNDYTAWLNGQSVARGTLREVRAKAEAIYRSPEWAAFEGNNPTTFRVTRGPRQFFVCAYEWPKITTKGE